MLGAGGGADIGSLSWPDNGLLVFRGASAEHFCLGGDPSERESFLYGLQGFASLLRRLDEWALPTVAVCHGATRGGGERHGRHAPHKRVQIVGFVFRCFSKFVHLEFRSLFTVVAWKYGF